MKEKTFYWLLASKWLESRYERFLDRFSSPCVVVVVVMVVIYSWPCPRRRSTLWCRARQGDARTYPAQPLSSAAVEWINLSTRVIIRIICIISRVEGSTEFHFFTILYSERTLLLLHCLLCFHAYGCLNTGSSLRIRWSYRELYTIKLFHAILSHFKPRRTLLVVGSLISEYW